MEKILYGLHITAIVVFCRFIAPYAGDDIALYAFSVLVSGLLLLKYRFISKQFLAHFLSLQGLTLWGCYFLLDQRYQLVTHRVSDVKALLLGLFLLLEVAALVHMFKRYRSARRAHGLFSAEAFAFALSPYPLTAPMQKLFVVEFNIWRAALVRLGLLQDQDGHGLRHVARIVPGYRPVHVECMIAALLVMHVLCLWLAHWWWLALPMLTSLWLSLLLNGDTLNFQRHAIYDTGLTLKIPNGVYGFISLEKTNIEQVLHGVGLAGADLSVSRLIPANILLCLTEAIQVFGAPVKTISVCVDDTSQFQQRWRIDCAAA